ncbi:MAG: fibronectin type III domain-containing protein [Crocinitomicaceae bacterium]|nr:fibronectin type III domain-containing protein [Crocinitomicaceae bacterium]
MKITLLTRNALLNGGNSLLFNSFLFLKSVALLFLTFISLNGWGQCPTSSYTANATVSPTCNNQVVSISNPNDKTIVTGFTQNKLYDLYVNTRTSTVNCIQARWQKSDGTPIGGWFSLNYANSGTVNYSTHPSPANAEKLEISSGFNQPTGGDWSTWTTTSAVLNYKINANPTSNAGTNASICSGENIQLGNQSNSYNKEIQIGTTNSSASENGFTNGYYDYSMSRHLYKESEINTSGMITSFSVYIENVPSNYTMTNQVIYFKNQGTKTAFTTSYNATTNGTIAGTPIADGFTQVYNGSLTFNGSGWFTITLLTPFYYSGTGSLELIWENRDASWANGYPTFRYQDSWGYYCSARDFRDNSFPSNYYWNTFQNRYWTKFNILPTVEYSWSPTTGLDNPNIFNPIATPTSTTTYTLTVSVEGATGCTPTNQVIVTVNTPSVAPTSISGTTTICSGDNTTLTAVGGSLGTNATYQWGTGSTVGSNIISGATNNTYVASPTSTTSYWVRIVGTASPCTPVNTAGQTTTVTVNPTTLPNTAGTYTSSTINHADGATNEYKDGCSPLGKITDAAGGNVLGNTTMTSTLAATNVVTSNPDGFIYGRRSYVVNPTSDGPVTVKMYFSQDDFDLYNTSAGSADFSFLSLPTSGNNSDPNIPHLRVVTVTSTSYVLSTTLPAGAVYWNGNFWEITFQTDNVNGKTFYIGTHLSCDGVAVNNLNYTNVTATGVTVTWSSVITTPSYGDYQFQYRIVGAPTWTSAGSANNPLTSKNISGLQPNTNYELQIRRHCNTQGQGPWSSSINFTTLGGTGCSAPMNFSTTSSTTTTVTLNWASVSGAAWYEIQYKESASPTWIYAGTANSAATSKTISGLTANTAYDFQIRNYCATGYTGNWSSTQVVSTTVLGGCELPPVLSTTKTATSVTLNWATVSGAAWYEFRYKEGNGAWISGGTATGTATTKTYTGLNPNTTYTFEAKSYCSASTSSAWDGVNVTTDALGGCELPPVISASNVTTNKIIINWTSVSGAGWYEFRYRELGNPTWTVGTANAAAVLKNYINLSPETTYEFQARTFCNAKTSSAWSSSLEVTTLGAAGLVQNNNGELENTNLDELAINEGESVLPSENTVASLEKAIEVVMYPNPTDNILNIDAVIENDNTVYLTVKVYDMSGRLVTGTSTLANYGLNTIRLSLGDLNSGLYTVELYNNDQFVNRTRVQKK